MGSHDESRSGRLPTPPAAPPRSAALGGPPGVLGETGAPEGTRAPGATGVLGATGAPGLPLAVDVSGLSRSFGDTRALVDLTLQIPQGIVYALVGPNGSGKSTLFRVLTGLLRPDQGEVRLLGRPIRVGSTPHPSLAFVPDRYALYENMTVTQHTEFVALFSARWDESFVQSSLDRLGFPPRSKVGALSQGRRAQFALILALGGRPDLLILDEPTANLDPIMRREVHQLVIGEASARGQTILLSSHNLTEVERVADRVGFLNRGRLVAERTVDEIRTQEHEVRVVLQSTRDVDLGAIPGVQSVQQHGNGFRLRVSGDLEPVLAALQQMDPFALEVVEQSLEDLFFTYSAGGEPEQKEV